MERGEIVARLKAHLEEGRPGSGEKLDEDTDLLEDRYADSLAVVETVLFLEEAFGLRLSGGDLNRDNFKSVAALADLVLDRFPEKG